MTPLGRQALAEGLGTGLLVLVVVGSGTAAAALADDQGVALLANTVATAGALVALITALQPVSAAFNPVVTLAERWLGALTSRDAAAHVAAQVAGGCAGAVLANLMFELPAVSVSTTVRSGPGQWLAEVVATAGLVVVVLGTVRAGRGRSVAVAVAGWITAAYWATSSTSFANPAVTVARALSDTYAGIAPASVPGFVAAQLVGGALGVVLARALYPDAAAVAGDLVALQEAR